MARIGKTQRRPPCTCYSLSCRSYPLLHVPISFLLLHLFLLLLHRDSAGPMVYSASATTTSTLRRLLMPDFSEYNAWRARLEEDKRSMSTSTNGSSGDQQFQQIEKNLKEMHDEDDGELAVLEGNLFPDETGSRDSSISPLFDRVGSASESKFGSLEDIINTLGIDDANVTTLQILEGKAIPQPSTSPPYSAGPSTLVTPPQSELSPQKPVPSFHRRIHSPSSQMQLTTTDQQDEYEVHYSFKGIPLSPPLGMMVSPSHVLPPQIPKQYSGGSENPAAEKINTVSAAPLQDLNTLSKHEDAATVSLSANILTASNISSPLRDDQFSQLKSQLLKPRLSQESTMTLLTFLQSLVPRVKPAAAAAATDEQTVVNVGTDDTPSETSKLNVKLPSFREITKSRRPRSTFMEVIGIDGSRRYAIEGENPYQSQYQGWENIDVVPLGSQPRINLGRTNTIERQMPPPFDPVGSPQVSQPPPVYPWQMPNQNQQQSPHNLLQQYLTSPPVNRSPLSKQTDAPMFPPTQFQRHQTPVPSSDDDVRIAPPEWYYGLKRPIPQNPLYSLNQQRIPNGMVNIPQSSQVVPYSDRFVFKAPLPIMDQRQMYLQSLQQSQFQQYQPNLVRSQFSPDGRESPAPQAMILSPGGPRQFLPPVQIDQQHSFAPILPPQSQFPQEQGSIRSPQIQPQFLGQNLQQRSSVVTPRVAATGFVNPAFAEGKITPLPPSATPVSHTTQITGNTGLPRLGSFATYTTLQSPTNFIRPSEPPSSLDVVQPRVPTPFPQQTFPFQNNYSPEKEFHQVSKFPFPPAVGPKTGGPIKSRGRGRGRDKQFTDPYTISQRYTQDTSGYFGTLDGTRRPPVQSQQFNNEPSYRIQPNYLAQQGFNTQPPRPPFGSMDQSVSARGYDQRQTNSYQQQYYPRENGGYPLPAQFQYSPYPPIRNQLLGNVERASEQQFTPPRPIPQQYQQLLSRSENPYLNYPNTEQQNIAAVIPQQRQYPNTRQQTTAAVIPQQRQYPNTGQPTTAAVIPQQRPRYTQAGRVEGAATPFPTQWDPSGARTSTFPNMGDQYFYERASTPRFSQNQWGPPRADATDINYANTKYQAYINERVGGPNRDESKPDRGKASLPGPKPAGSESPSLRPFVPERDGTKGPISIGAGTGSAGFAFPIIDPRAKRPQLAGTSANNGVNTPGFNPHGFRNDSSGGSTENHNDPGGATPSNVTQQAHTNAEKGETGGSTAADPRTFTDERAPSNRAQTPFPRKHLPHHGGDMPFYTQSEVDAHHQRMLTNSQTAKDSEFENDSTVLSWYLHSAKQKLRSRQGAAAHRQHEPETQASNSAVRQRPSLVQSDIRQPSVQSGHFSPAQLTFPIAYSPSATANRGAETQRSSSSIPNSPSTSHDRWLLKVPSSAPVVQAPPSPKAVHGNSSTNGFQPFANQNGLSSFQRSGSASSASPSQISQTLTDANVHSAGTHPGGGLSDSATSLNVKSRHGREAYFQWQ